MSFADPQSVTFAAPLAGTVSLPRVTTGKGESQYKSSDGLVSLTAKNLYNKRTRRLLRLDYTKIAADVFQPEINVSKGMACYIVFDEPTVGFTNAEKIAIYGGFKGAITASTDLLVSKLVGGES